MTKICLTLAVLSGISAFALPVPVHAQAPAGSTAAAVPPTQVSYYRGSIGHTGVSPESLTGPLSLLWRHTTQAAPNDPASPVYSGGTVYFVSGGVAYAASAADGTSRWQYPADGKAVSIFGATPALDSGFLYLTDDAGQVTKLDAATGKLVWKSKLDGILRSAPVVSGGSIYLGSSNGHCYALGTDTGQTLWDVATTGAITTSPVVTGGLVVFTSSDNSVYSLNGRTGRKAWSDPYDADPSIVPVVYDGRILYVTAGDTVYSLDPSSGRQRTTTKLATNVLIPPTLGPDSTFVITQSNAMYALGTGGRELWKITLDSTPTAPPLLAGNLLLVTTQMGVLSGYDPSSGHLVWRYVMQASATDSQPKETTANVVAPPIVADGTLYVVSDDGSLSAFRHDAVDTIGPEILQSVPAAGSTVPAANLIYGALVVDQGSGVNPSSISLEIDGKADPLALFHADANAIYNTPTTPLTEGDHQITVKAADWRGNATSQTWSFTVRNNTPNRGRFNPFGGGYPGGGGRNPNAPPPPPGF